MVFWMHSCRSRWNLHVASFTRRPQAARNAMIDAQAVMKSPVQWVLLYQ
jgi:hypothetical protein